MTHLARICSLGACLALIVGCQDRPENSAPTAPEKASAALVVTTHKTADSPVAKIVFVGQKDACECTRDRINNSWAALQKAVGDNAGVLVERIQLDVDEQEADRLDDLRTMIVVPGIYFIDKREGLLEMLQGEVTVEQISRAL